MFEVFDVRYFGVRSKTNILEADFYVEVFQSYLLDGNVKTVWN